MEVDSNHRSNLQQIYSLSPLATRESIHVKWDLQGSNLWPSACKADALPAELRSHITTQKRLELSTSAVTGRRSNQLSHWAILQFSESYVPSKLHTVKTNIIIQTYHCFGYALDLLVTVSSMCYHTSTSALSTSSSSRGLTNLTLWDISSWGGLHA